MTSSILSPPPYQQPPAMHGYGAPPPPPQHAAPRTYIASSTPRYAIAHGQNSAHSPSANPDEDWTKISDLAERRRIQNRIAQRNYRKKLKRRLEDLERRASSPSPPPGSNAAMVGQQDPKRRPSKNGSMPAKRSPNPSQGVFPPGDYSSAAANGLYPPNRRDSRQPSITPPPSMTHSTGSTTTSPSMPPYYQPGPPAHQAGQPPYYGAPYSDAGYPSMQQPILPPPAGLGLSRIGGEQEPWQQKPYPGDEMFNQFGMSNQYPASTGAPYENGVPGVSTGYPEQGIYSNPPMGY